MFESGGGSIGPVGQFGGFQNGEEANIAREDTPRLAIVDDLETLILVFIDLLGILQQEGCDAELLVLSKLVVVENLDIERVVK